MIEGSKLSEISLIIIIFEIFYNDIAYHPPYVDRLGQILVSAEEIVVVFRTFFL